MAWTTITGTEDNLDENVADFASGVTSIDSFSVASHGHGQVVALVEYTA
jgi:hypothetical protein